MANWSFRDALEELEVKGHFDESMLQSNVGLHLGDIRFDEMQTTLRMCTVYFSMFMQYTDQGSFNADNLPVDGCSQTTAILLAFIPDWRLEDIESMGIGNVIWRCRSPIGDLSSIKMVINTICSVLGTEHKKNPMKRQAYMVLIGNYSGHMAFATDPPYFVAYSTDYKTNHPSQMTPRHTENHSYAMVTTNMIVRRLLSLPNWEPMVRKQTKGGCLLIPRGVQFGPTLFPEIVVPRNHASPPVDPVTHQEAPFWTVGPFWAIDTIFPSFPVGLELFTAEEVVKLKELGVLNPPNAPERPPLFLPLVSSSRGKVVSTVLGMPPPSFEAHGIEQSLMTNQDEESILSDSYSDRHSINVDSSTTWGRPTVRISERESKSHTTERKDKDSHRSSEKDCDRNHDRSKKSDSWCATEQSRRCSLLCRDNEGDCTSNGKCKRLCGQESPSDSHKNKQRCGRSTSPSHDRKRSHTPEGWPLLPPPMFHSTPLQALRRLSSDLLEPNSAHLSFNQSRSSLPPLDLGGGDARPILSTGVPIQGVCHPSQVHYYHPLPHPLRISPKITSSKYSVSLAKGII